MIAVPFIGLLFAIVETALLLFTNQALDTALQDTSRKIMTGEAQNSGMTAAQFKNAVCAIATFNNCSSALYVDVKSYTSTAPVPTLPITNGVFDPSQFTFNPGCPNQIVVARVAMQYPVYSTLFGAGLQQLSNGERVMMSTVSFRNEPYVTSNSGCS